MMKDHLLLNLAERSSLGEEMRVVTLGLARDGDAGKSSRDRLAGE